MTSKVIDELEHVILSLERLSTKAKTLVEKIDISDVMSNIKCAKEKLEALESYQSDEHTDYEQLWIERKDEIKEYQRSRDSWIRSEIITRLLTPTTTSGVAQHS